MYILNCNYVYKFGIVSRAMNWRTLGNCGLVYGLAALCFVSECSQEIGRRREREARAESQPTTMQVQRELDSLLDSQTPEIISENSLYYDLHENEIYNSFGGKEALYKRVGWGKNRKLNEREKAAVASLYRGLGSEGIGGFAP